MDSAAFRRDRLQAAVTKLGVRLRELRAEEEDSRRTTAYEAVKAKRDKLAAELANVYPAIERLELAPVSLDTTLFNGTEKERGS
jgi:hypothetical protein